MVLFWYKFSPKGYNPLRDFYKIGLGRNSQALTLVPNLTIVTFKMWLTAPKIAEIGNFWYKFAKKGYTPLSDFYKIWLGGGSFRSAPSYTKFHRSGFKNVGLQPQKSRKIAIFSINFPLWENFGGPHSTEKVEYRCTTTNRPLCNDTIIVLKIAPLHSVSVITNFVIPKRDKQNTNKQKNITLFRLQPARDPRSPPYLAR